MSSMNNAVVQTRTDNNLTLATLCESSERCCVSQLAVSSVFYLSLRRTLHQPAVACAVAYDCCGGQRVGRARLVVTPMTP